MFTYVQSGKLHKICLSEAVIHDNIQNGLTLAYKHFSNKRCVKNSKETFPPRNFNLHWLWMESVTIYYVKGPNVPSVLLWPDCISIKRGVNVRNVYMVIPCVLEKRKGVCWRACKAFPKTMLHFPSPRLLWFWVGRSGEKKKEIDTWKSLGSREGLAAKWSPRTENGNTIRWKEEEEALNGAVC